MIAGRIPVRGTCLCVLYNFRTTVRIFSLRGEQGQRYKGATDLSHVRSGLHIRTMSEVDLYDLRGSCRGSICP